MAPTQKATTKTKKDTRKSCTVCKKKYQPVDRRNMVCSEECKKVRRSGAAKTVTRKKREPKPTPMTNPFIKLILRHAKQAGTVQVMQYITAEQLLELREMHKRQQKINSLRSRAFGQYDFSHIYPVKGQRYIGKFTPANLVVANGDLNKKHGNKHFGSGEFISPAHKSTKWDIRSGMNDQEILDLMIQCITRPVWDAFTKVAKLQPSARQMHLDTLGKLLDRSSPDHIEYLKIFDNASTSTADLKNLVEAVTGKEVFQRCDLGYASPLRILIQETARLTAYRPELQQVSQVLMQVNQMAVHFTRNDLDLNGADESFFFNILHGHPLDESTMQQMNSFLVHNLSVLFDGKLLQPKYAPMDSSVLVLSLPDKKIERQQRREARRGTTDTVPVPTKPDFWDTVIEYGLVA